MSQEALNAERRARMALERRLAEIESRVRSQWLFTSNTSSSASYTQLLIGSGNLLATVDSIDYYGLKYAATLTSVPSASPSAIGTIYSDGLTAAYNLGTDPDATTGTLVWVTSAGTVTIKNPAGGADTTTSNVQQYQIASGTFVLSLTAYSVPISGSPGTYAQVYVPAIPTT